MLDTIVRLLNEAGVSAWELSDVQTEGWEFYFIRHNLDQNRVKNVEHITVKVYQLIEDGACLGSASCEIAPTADEAEIRGKIADLAYRATLVKNRAYTLRTPEPVEPGTAEPIALDAIAGDFLRTLRALPETAGEDINSYEIFVSSKTRRFLSSTGIDVEERYPDSMLEVVVNARREDHEIELYRNYKSGSCDVEGLRRDLKRTMRYGKDRLIAKPTPAIGKADVLFTTSDAVSLYAYFADRLNTAMVYRKMSDWKPGEPVAANFRGDRPSLYARRELPNSSKNHALCRRADVLGLSGTGARFCPDKPGGRGRHAPRDRAALRAVSGGGGVLRLPGRQHDGRSLWGDPPGLLLRRRDGHAGIRRLNLRLDARSCGRDVFHARERAV